MQTCDVAVIGAGIVGVACAYELARGGLRTALVDPNPIGSGSTTLDFGSLSIQTQSADHLAISRFGLSLWDALADGLPADCEFQRCGSLILAMDENERQLLFNRCLLLNRQGIFTEMLDPRQLAKAEPCLNHTLPTAALHIPGDACVRASRGAADAIFQLAIEEGVRHFQKRALNFQDHELTFNDDSTLLAGNIVNACGTEALALTPNIPLHHSKGHLILVQDSRKLIQHQIAVATPEDVPNRQGPIRLQMRQNPQGEMWIGSLAQSASKGDTAAHSDPKVIAHLLRRAIELIPEIAVARPLRTWTGIVPATSDGLPLIGRLDDSNVFLATGHEFYAATTALATGRLIADEILFRPSDIDPTPYKPNRSSLK